MVIVNIMVYMLGFMKFHKLLKPAVENRSFKCIYIYIDNKTGG